MPAEVSSDTTVNATTANNMIGQLEGTANLPSACGTNMGTCTSGRNNSYYMAGLAYDAHTKDIRSDLTGSQTISTYWLDVMEGQTYLSKNQYWLAAKYGGFTVPGGFSPYAASNGTGTLADSAWWTTTELTPGGADKRPDNYFLANQADKMVDGLTKAFAKIVSENDGATTTAFSTPTAEGEHHRRCQLRRELRGKDLVRYRHRFVADVCRRWHTNGDDEVGRACAARRHAAGKPQDRHLLHFDRGSAAVPSCQSVMRPR